MLRQRSSITPSLFHMLGANDPMAKNLVNKEYVFKKSTLFREFDTCNNFTEHFLNVKIRYFISFGVLEPFKNKEVKSLPKTGTYALKLLILSQRRGITMDKDQQKGVSPLAKYSSMGVELVLVLCLAAWLGRWLDAQYQVESGLFTIFLMLFALVGSMYRLIKRLMHEQNKK